MHRALALSLLTPLLCLFLAGQAVAATIYVASSGATVKAEASASSATVAAPAVGTGLEVLETAARWHRVRTPTGQVGWIYRGKVSTVKPQTIQTAGGQSSAGDLLGGLTGSSIQANAASSSRSIRGLSPEAEAYAAQTGAAPAAKAALDDVLAHPLPAADIDKFLMQSKIGEYAE